MPGGRKRRTKSSHSRYGKRRAVPRSDEPVPSAPESNGSSEEAGEVADAEYVPEGEGVNVEEHDGVGEDWVAEIEGVNEDENEGVAEDWVAEIEGVSVEEHEGVDEDWVAEIEGADEEASEEAEEEWTAEELIFSIGEPEPVTLDTDPLGRPCFAVEGDVVSESGKNYLVLTFSFLN